MKKTLLICAAILLVLPGGAASQNIIATTATCTNATIDAGTAGCVIINVAGQGSLGFQITGTWTGTVTFSTSLGQNGADATFVTTLVTPVGSATQTSTATANGVWSLPVAGFNQFKIAITATGTGTAVVNRRTTSQARSGGGGGGGSGTVTSVGLSLPGGITVTNSPVTTTGTLTGTLFSGDTQVLYNNSGAFAGDAGLTYTAASDTLTIGTEGNILPNPNSVGLAFTAASTNVEYLFTNTMMSGGSTVTIMDQPGDTGIGIEANNSTGSIGISGFGTPGNIVIDTDGVVQFGTAIELVPTGVRLSTDNDGALTILGLGDGSDEDLTLNFDDVANTVGVSSSTGVTAVDFVMGLVSTSIWLDTNGIGGRFNSTLDDGGSGSTQNSAVQGYATTVADAGVYARLTGFNSDVEFYGTATLAVANGVNVFVYNDDGTITSMEGIRIELDNQDTATNTYGVRILSVTGGTQTNLAWSFYSADDASRSRIPNLISAGTIPSVANVGANSCGTTAASITGNSNSGRVTVGATSGTQCRVTTTITAPTGWQCSASNTTTAALARCVGVDTTHFDLVGVFTAADVLSFVALPN